MSQLVVQITKQCFKDILEGKQKSEGRFVWRSVWKKYFKYGYDEEIPDEVMEKAESDPYAIMRKYDTMVIINGRRKDSPRLEVEIVGARYFGAKDQNGEQIVVEGPDDCYNLLAVVYDLGRIIKTENC